MDEFDTSRKAKSGRRAGKKDRDDVQESVDIEPAVERSHKPRSSQENKNSPAASRDAGPRPKRISGWGEEADEDNSQPFGGGDKGKSRGTRKHVAADDSDDDAADIPEIPDLDDSAPAAAPVSEMAHAPTFAVNRVATYNELDHDLSKYANIATLDNEINLKLLTKCLSADPDLQEPDELWEWDRLFTDVTTDLQETTVMASNT